MNLRILGISGSPVKKGNTESFLRAMIGGVADGGDHVEIVDLCSHRIDDCIHCNFCLSKQVKGKYCTLRDDARAIFKKAEAADFIMKRAIELSALVKG